MIRNFHFVKARFNALRGNRPAPAYILYAPGIGALGDYPTPDEAETARARLPQPLLARAAVYDEDGFCVAC